MSYNTEVEVETTNSVKVKPKIYSLLLKMGRESVIHMGIYESLDDAYKGAMNELYGDRTLLGAVESRLPLEMWTAINIQDLPVMPTLEPVAVTPVEKDPQGTKDMTVREYVSLIKDFKNMLMNTIIDSGKAGDVSKASSVLTKSEKKFLLERVKE